MYLECLFFYGTWRQVLPSLLCHSSWTRFYHMYVWVAFRFWMSGGLGDQTFRRDWGHIHYFQRNFILQSHHFFEIWKIWVGCYLNVTKFPIPQWSLLSLDTIDTIKEIYNIDNIYPYQLHSCTNISQNAKPHRERRSNLNHQLIANLHLENSPLQPLKHVTPNTTKTWFITSPTTFWLRNNSHFSPKAYPLFLPPPKLKYK